MEARRPKGAPVDIGKPRKVITVEPTPEPSAVPAPAEPEERPTPAPAPAER
jgi:hypothetical protein